MSFNETRALNFNRFLASAPNKIYVDRVNGLSPGIGGLGSLSAPFSTISEAIPSLIGNDVILWRGDPLGDTGAGGIENQAVFNSVNNLAIVSIGEGITQGEGGNMRFALAITNITSVGGGVVEITSAAHGLAVGDYVVLDIPAADGNQGSEYSSVWRVDTVPTTTTFRVTLPIVNPSNPPFTGGDRGRFWRPALVFNECGNVIVYGMTFTGSVGVPDSWTGVAVTNAQLGRNIHFVDCIFGRASVAARGQDPTTNTDKPVGSGFRVEACRFTPDFNTLFHTAAGSDLSAIYLAGMFDWVVSRCQFNKSLVTASQRPWAAPGLIRVDRRPVLNGIITGCLKGATADPRLFYAGGVAVEQSLVNDNKVAIQQNFLNGVPGGAPAFVSAANIIRDESPAFFPFQFEVSTPSQIVTQATQFEDNAVHIDTIGGGTAGTRYPIGTVGTPVSNVADARTIANTNSKRKYVVRGSITLAQAHTDWEFVGARGPEQDTVNPGGQDVSGSNFERIRVTGTQSGANAITVVESIVENLVAARGTFLTTLFRGTITPEASASVNLLNCAAEAPGLTIDMVNGGATFGSALFNGIAVVDNLVTGSVTLAFATGLVTLNASCTGGLITLAGEVGAVTDNSAGSTVLDLTSSGVRQRFILETATGGRVDLDITADPWRERHYDEAGTTIVRQYELFDQSGANINGDENSGNNPLRNSNVLVARKVLV